MGLNRLIMNKLSPFHLAIPVKDLKKAKTFYKDILGLEEGRSSNHWTDFNFFGHQLVIHLDENSTKSKNKTLQLNNILLDLSTGSIKGLSKDLSLSENEIKILEILSSKPGESFKREFLIKSLGFNQERTLDVCINRLRKKIEKNPKVPKYLKTKRGSGYVLWID